MRATSPPNVIRTEGLTKIYRGAAPAVDELDLAVRQGEIFGLLGPNGAGKSTTIGMLTTRVVPTAGRALVGGIDVVTQPARVKQLIGVVNETNTLDRRLTVWENLYFHARYFGMKRKAAGAASDQMLERFRLADKAKAPVHALSRGMAQRLMLARGVMHRPAVLFLDEPTGGLDPQSRLGLWELLRELHADGQTILLTTHYIEEADELCDRVAIMDHGRILAMDVPEALKRSYGATLNGKVRVNGAARLRLKTAKWIVGKVTAAVGAGGSQLADDAFVEPTLETVFLNLTGKELRE